MKRILLIIATLIPMNLFAQSSWTQFDKLMKDGSYKSAYSLAEGVYKKSTVSADRLAAAYHMAVAAAPYQEDVRDSAEARYRALLPTLEPLEKALCHAFLGEYDQALEHADLLKRTPVEDIKQYCEGDKELNMTPTAYDVIVTKARDESWENYGKRLELHQKLIDFHAQDGDDIRIWLDFQKLDLLASTPNRHDGLAMYQQAIDKFRGTKSPWYTLLYRRAAEWCHNEERYVDALRYCDTAIALAPKSEGGVACANLRVEILAKTIHVEDEGLRVIPGQPSLQRVRYHNLDRLYYRIVPYMQDYQYGEKTKAKLLAAKAVVSGEWQVVRGKDYHEAESFVALPALKTGRYLLLVSPTEDFKREGFMAYEMACSEMLLVQNYQEGLLLDRRTGRPIAGQKMRVERERYKENPQVLATATTDANGRYRFDCEGAQWNDQVVVERDGYTLKTRFQCHSGKPNVDMHLCAQLRTDRPIYKPGDTLQVAVVAYRSNGRDGVVAAGERLTLMLVDPNGQNVDTLTLTTDDFGVANASFVIPTDRVAGMYALKVESDGEYVDRERVRVEEYKQPKFMVTLHADGGDAPQFGKPYTVQGLAASYSDVPVSGARVQYQIRRAEAYHYGWRQWGLDDDVEVADGEVTTAADGSFSITFTPEPDSNVELEDKPVFAYQITANVTDLNGESHEAYYTVNIGFNNAILGLANYQSEISALKELTVVYEDLNDHPLDGMVRVKVERLRPPAVPLLNPPIHGYAKVQHTMSEEEWRKTFPLYAYDENYNEMYRWAVEKVVESGEWRVESGKCVVPLPQLVSGTYRVTLSAEGADTAVQHITLTLPDEKKPQSQNLLWSEVDKTKAEVGETVRLRFGSRFKDVEVYYMLHIGQEERSFQRFKISDEIKTVEIPVDSAMLGGFQLDIVTVLEGVYEYWNQRIEVPYSHKELKMEIATFRDKLLPGETEEWTIRVRSSESGVQSALVMTMYDDALNSYGFGQWGFKPWWSNGSSEWSFHKEFCGVGRWMNEREHFVYSGDMPSVWSLKEALPYYNPWRGRRYRSVSMAKNNVMYDMVEEEAVVLTESVPVIEIGAPESGARLTADDIARMPGTTVESVVAAVGGVGYNDGGSQQKVQVRTNLNTLAFFAPALRTDKDGMVTYRFTVPELLTRWNVRGLAVTKDIKIGTLDKKLVTQKPLMVQPNMPRFLRSGDSLGLMAKVVRSEELGVRSEELPVEVMFVLTDAATGDTICHHIESVLVKDAAQVTFDVEVPQHVYVATYKIVVSCQLPEGSYSDGEQGQLPVVTNRQAVTLSQAMYINGAGEKHYTMPEFLAGSDSREPHLVAAEVVSNPIWLAVKSMPYLKTSENPSTLYLANQLYLNSKGREVIDMLGTIDKIDVGGASRLKMNEDVKQTLLKATPWVQDAQSEEEQMAAVANYLDKERLAAELQKTGAELANRQNPDGGWSWMPEGKSSLWITQQVLKKVVGGQWSEISEKALAYIDREQQQYYDRYIKPYLKKGYSWNPTDIDYLYTRSFFGKANTEAYKYYYSNALKRYKEFGNLYTQAQLALIFHRNGDRKQALDLLRRLKEKSLTSDEMGMYWRDNTSGWFWYQRPVETQALLIQAFAEITPDDSETVGLMQQWLLKQKQTTHWGNDEATTKAISALMQNTSISPSQAGSDSPASLTIFDELMTAGSQGLEGYRSQRWTDDALDTLIAHQSSLITLKKADDGIAWGAVYYQFTDDMDKIPATDMGITIRRTYTPTENLKVGDKIKVRIDITCDRAMEYLELIDGRPSCVEPLSTRAGWRWNEGLSYYIVVGNTDTRCYIDRLDKGKYYFEYEVFVTNPGHFLSGPVVMQCMYAPEFRATAPAQTIIVNH